jgi:cytochrome oxidase assembly protein ShyY1
MTMLPPDDDAPMSRLERKAWEYHEENPEVWKLVCNYAEQAKRRRFTKFAIDMIWNVIRWERQLAVGPEHVFKMPNNHRAYYARWYNAATGALFFKECRLRSLGGGSYDEFGRDEGDIEDDARGTD